MNDDILTINQCLSNPGLVISVGASPLVKYANTFQAKVNSRISPAITTANAPSLALATLIAPFPNGVPALAGNLAAGFSRIYTLVATLPITGSSTVTPTFSWIASSDFLTVSDLANFGASTVPNQSNQVVVGQVIVANGTASAFVPGTTALDTALLTVTYLNNYAIVGA